MLMQMRPVTCLGSALLAAVAMMMAAVVAPPVASAAGDAECRFGACTVRGEKSGSPGGGDLTQPVVGPGESEPTSNYCQAGWTHERGDCDQNIDPAKNCMWRLMENQPPPPDGKDPSCGAWEECVPEWQSATDVFRNYPQRWWERPSAAGAADAEQAARELVTQMQLEGIEIGMVPYSVQEDGTGAVGLPAWMWVENTENPRAWGPYTVSKEVNGIAVQATARPVHVTWDMGDGTQVVCDGPGTVYEDRFGKQESPDCGHTYMKMSNPTYKVTAITTWSVEWTAQGQSGVIETLTRSSQDVRIGEFQALNVRP